MKQLQLELLIYPPKEQNELGQQVGQGVKDI